jgi:hypothetical protein
MDHIDKFDTSCWEMASKLSCDHMKSLAIDELNYNKHIFDTNTCDPAWNRNIEERDRNLEYNILSGFSINKKSCMYKKPDFNNGCWDKQFGIYNPLTGTVGCSMNEIFDENSKKKSKDIKPCIEDIKLNNSDKKLTTHFNHEFYSVEPNNINRSKNANGITGTEDRYNNHNPYFNDEYAQPSTLNRSNPCLIKDPNYKPRKHIYPPIRTPSQYSDCSTLYNYDRYNDNKNNKLYFEPCSFPN